MRQFLYIITMALFAISCADKDKESDDVTSEPKQSRTNLEVDEQLNITILLDLSDRIEPSKYSNTPEHFERDIEIVNYFTEIFKSDMEKKGAYKAKGKLKVIFSPRPNDSEINQIASELSIDLSKAKDPKEKKQIFENVSSNFKRNLERIYSKTIETKSYPGSDIWRFFKNDVVDYAISDDKNYRNILVILTDGYIYHENSKERQGNRSMSLLPQDVRNQGFSSNNWKEKMDQKDYGYISTRDDLENLDVLVLEVNPISNVEVNENVIKAYLERWFKEMKVNKHEVYKTDLPHYTKAKIDKFINNG